MDLGLLIKTPAEIGHCLDNKKRGTFLSLSLCVRCLCSECLRLNQHVRSSELSPRRGWTEDRERRRIKRTLSLPFRFVPISLSFSLSARAKAPSANFHANFQV